MPAAVNWAIVVDYFVPTILFRPGFIGPDGRQLRSVSTRGTMKSPNSIEEFAHGQRAEELLKEAEVELVDVALTVGFQTQAHFTTVFKRFAGNTPYQWRSAHLAECVGMPPVRARLP
jgi:AraC-like DNA-binding protein